MFPHNGGISFIRIQDIDVEVYGGRYGEWFDQEFADKRVLVTGGRAGMGKAIVQRFRAAGATVMTTARKGPAHIEVADLSIEADVSTADGAASIANAVTERMGGIDILVNVVGGSQAASHEYVIDGGAVPTI